MTAVAYEISAEGRTVYVCLRCAALGADEDMTVEEIEVPAEKDTGPLSCECCGRPINHEGEVV